MMESHDGVLIFITSKQEEVTKKLRSVSLFHKTACALSFSQNLHFFFLFNFLFLALSGHGDECWQQQEEEGNLPRRRRSPNGDVLRFGEKHPRDT